MKRDIDLNDGLVPDTSAYDAMENPEYRRVLREVVDRYARLKRKTPLPVFEDLTLPMMKHPSGRSIGTP